MSPLIRHQWAEALRSGRYRPHHDEAHRGAECVHLRNGQKQYCAFGVLVALGEAATGRHLFQPLLGIGNADCEAIIDEWPALERWAGMIDARNSDTPDGHLIAMVVGASDAGMSFEQIAEQYVMRQPALAPAGGR